MDNCLIVDGGSVTGLRASGITYMFPEPIAFAMLEREGRAFITAFETNPVKAMEMVGVNIKVENTGIRFEEEQSEGYIERTKKNASADATLDFAFGSEGEAWTKKAVINQKKKHIGTNLKSLEITPELVNNFVNELNSVNAKTLNIAGQGIYNIKNYTQEQIDTFVYNLLSRVLNSPNLKTKIVSIRTGGQTGFDEAGTKAGIKLGINTLTLAPKGWVFRPENNLDVKGRPNNKELFLARFEGVKKIDSNPQNSPLFVENNNRVNTEEYKWARTSDNSYEVSSKGDKRFSAFFAQLNDGRYIEDIYQLDIKGNGVAQSKPITNKQNPDKSSIQKTGSFTRQVSKEQSWNEYKNLWIQYLNENPNLLEDLKQKAKGKVLTDMFANTDVSQARALAEILNNQVDTNNTESQNNKPKAEFLGYKGGFDPKGKGSNEGDGKDKAMREAADGFIGEIVKKDSSSYTSAKAIENRFLNDKDSISKYKDGFIDDYIEEDFIVNSGKMDSKKVMLARNGEFRNKPLDKITKILIEDYSKDGATFVVGDMPGVDTQFIEYLIEIGAKFEVYHTDNKKYWTDKNQKENIGKSRIDVNNMIRISQRVNTTGIKQMEGTYDDFNDSNDSEIAKNKIRNLEIGKKILDSLGEKIQNRQPNGNIAGSKNGVGWKIRMNIKNPKTNTNYEGITNKDPNYIASVKTVNNFLNEYFGVQNDDSTKPFKNEKGGDIGQADFTIYIGSADDVSKFINDVRTKHPEIIKLLTYGKQSTDEKIDDLFHGRFSGSKIGFGGYDLPSFLDKLSNEKEFDFYYNNDKIQMSYGENIDDHYIIINDKDYGAKGQYEKTYSPQFVKENPELAKKLRTIMAFELFGDYAKGSQGQFENMIGNTVQETDVENDSYPLEYRYIIPLTLIELRSEIKNKLLNSDRDFIDKVIENVHHYKSGIGEASYILGAIENAKIISSTTKKLYNEYQTKYDDVMFTKSVSHDDFDKEGSDKFQRKIQESLLQDYYNYLKSIGYTKPFFTKYTGKIPDHILENFKSNQETIEEPLFSKFDTETNPTQDFKDLIQSLSDKLGIPVRYDNNLPYAGAFIDGNVVLNPSKMDETTVWHEFAHPFVQAVRKQNKPLYDNLVNEIYNTPHGKALLKEVQSLYGEKNQKIQEEEVIVELIARYASGKIDGFTAKKYKSIWDKIKDFIRSIGKMIFKNNNVVDTSAVNVFTMNPTMSIKDISNMMKYSEIIWFSKAEENMNNYEKKLENLTVQLRQAEYNYNSKKEEIEAYKNVENYDVTKANFFLNTLGEEVDRVKQHLSNLKIENKKGFKTNEKTAGELNGVHHNIGAFMSNAGLNTVEEALQKIIDFLKNNRTMELAAWNGKSASLEEGAIRISFKKDAVVKDSFTQDAFTFLDDADSEGNRERFSPNTHLRDKEGSKINPFSATESIISINKSNVESINILSPNDWYPKEEIQKLVRELSDLTGASVIVEPLMRNVYTPENKVEYQPEIYESRFGNKNSKVESLKSILSDYGTSYDSFSPQLKSQIETKLTNNPELLDDSNFIKSLTC